MESVGTRRRVRVQTGLETARSSYRSHYYGSSERISISTEHYSDAVDYCGRGAVGVLGLNVSASGLRQPIRRGQTREAPLISAKGVKLWVGWAVLLTLVLILTIVLLVNAAKMKEAEKRCTDLETDIAAQQEIIDNRQDQLTAKKRNLNIAYQAARLGMVSAGDAETIDLTLDPVIQTSQAAADQTASGD